MLKFNEHRGVLEEHSYHHELQNVDKPNYYRQMFDYESIPKIAFNFINVPMQPAENIFITDTTFRDGQQSTSPFTKNQIVDLFKLLHKIHPKGLIRNSEFFLYSDKDRSAVEACQDLGYEFPEITSWIRANKQDFELVKKMGIKETGILVSCSDYHIFNKMGWNRKQALENYLAIVKDALAFGVVPRCHFEDITRADFYGFVVPFAYELMKLSEEANVPIKIRACDTMGFGVTYPGAALPRSVQGIIYGLQHYGGVPSEQLEWHGHNDFYKVVNNASTAWLYGCSSVNCSLLGIGERTGNCPLEAMVIEYVSLRGDDSDIDFGAITEIAHYFEREIGYIIPPRTPFVGRNFNSTRAGIHADGMLKDEEIYNIFDTAKILNRPPRIAISNTSGLAGISFWINEYFELEGENKIDKKAEIVVKIKEEVDRQYEDGRNSTFGDDELSELIRIIDKDLYKRLEVHIK